MYRPHLPHLFGAPIKDGIRALSNEKGGSGYVSVEDLRKLLKKGKGGSNGNRIQGRNTSR